MSEDLPAITAKEVVRALEKARFERWRQRGSHLTMYRPRGFALTTITGPKNPWSSHREV